MARHVTSIRTTVKHSGPDFTNRKYWERQVESEMTKSCREAVEPIKHELNATEKPDKDPRKSFVDVKKWVAEFKSKSWSGGTLSMTIRATNKQRDTSYEAVRTIKGDEINVSDYSGIYTFGGNRSRAAIIKELIPNRTKRTRAPITETAFKQYFTQYGGDPNRLTKSLSRSLVVVRVPIGNIAFSRTFPALHTIRPSRTKYNSDAFARCLKIWDGTKFRYIAYANPDGNPYQYIKSRTAVMTNEMNRIFNDKS